MSGEGNRQFDMEIVLEASVEATWKALSDAREVQRWFAPEVQIEPGPGGSVRWAWGDSHAWPQRIEIWEPGSHLRTTYESQVEDGQGGKRPLVMDFHLKGQGGKTTLRMVHSGFGPESDFDTEFDGISRGWPIELRSLRLYLEDHLGKDRQVVWSVRKVSGSFAEAWQALTGESGLRCGEAIGSLQEDDRFAFETSEGDRFEGFALRSAENEFCGVVTSHGNAFLRFTIEACMDDQVWFWIGLYGRPESEVRGLQERADAMLSRLFQADGVGAGS